MTDELLLDACAKGNMLEVMELVEKGAEVNWLQSSRKPLHPIHMATFEGHGDVVAYLLDKGADIESRGMLGTTPLFLAAASGQLPMVCMLLQRGASVHALDIIGKTPVLAALNNGHFEVALLLEQQDATQVLPEEHASGQLIASTEEVEMCFLLMSYKGHLQYVMELVRQKGIEIMRAVNEDGNRAIHLATLSGNKDLVAYLLSLGASVGDRGVRDATPLHMAVQEGHLEVAKLLIREGADVHAEDLMYLQPIHLAAVKGDEPMLKMLLDAGADVDQVGGFEMMTPLSLAVDMDHVRMVCLLLSRGASPYSQDTTGMTLHQRALEKGHSGVARLLEQREASGLAKRELDFNLLDACSKNNLKKVKKLVKKRGADVKSAVDNKRNGVLHHAASTGNVQMVAYLLKAGARMNTLNIMKRNPLHVAAERGGSEIVSLLLREGANLKAKDKFGYQPIHMAAFGGQEAVVEVLLDAGAEVDSRDRFIEITPLYIAAQKGHLAVVRLLLSRGASTLIMSVDEKTPHQLALEKGHNEIVCLLEQHENQLSARRQEAEVGVEDALPGQHEIFQVLESLLSFVEKSAMPEKVKYKKEKLQTQELQEVEEIKDEDFFEACAEGSLVKVQELVDLGTDMGAKDEWGNNPIHVAAMFGCKSVVSHLLQLGAGTEDKGGLGCTPLQLAAVGGHLDLLSLLIRRGADVMAESESGSLPVHWATIGGHVPVLDCLLDKHGASVHDMDAFSRTPMHCAATHGHLPIVHVLLERGASLDFRDLRGRSPFQVAMEEGHDEVAHLLKQHEQTRWSPWGGVSDGNNLMIEEGKKERRLEIQVSRTRAELEEGSLTASVLTQKSSKDFLKACSRGDLAEVKNMFMEMSAEVMEAKDECGNTAVHLASRYGHVQVLDYILQEGVEVDSPNEDGWTALHCAAESGHMEVVRKLLSAGASPQSRDKGKTPLQRAQDNGHVEVAKLLADHQEKKENN